MASHQSEIEAQRHYYASTAAQYDSMHVQAKDEHGLALGFLLTALDYFELTSVLDVGAGTGRALQFIQQNRPEVRVMGVEPVEALRRVGYAKGIGQQQLVDGDGTRLPFGNGEFDVVCEFGVLHHVRHPQQVVAEMLRVADKAIFISDSNNFGQGSWPSRCAKQLLDHLGLWKVADLLKTRGKGYSVSDGDGVAYSYSVFNNYKQIRAACDRVHILNTQDAQINPYRSAGHVALLGVK